MKGKEAPVLVNFADCLLGPQSTACRINSLDVQHFCLCACWSGLPAPVSTCPDSQYFACDLKDDILTLRESDKGKLNIFINLFLSPPCTGSVTS